MTLDLREALCRIPKAELHVHFEGTVSPQTLITLARNNDVSLAEPVRFGAFPPLVPPRGTSTGTPTLSDFRDFIGLYVKIADSIRTHADMVAIGDAYLESAAFQNITISEIYFTPSTFVTLGRDIDQLFSGLVEVQQRAVVCGHSIRWIFDIVRNLPTDGFDTLELAEHAKQRGVNVVAIGLAGYEAEGLAGKFVDVFRSARSKGYACLAHAGETAGPDSVEETIQLLEPDRIGHGVRVIENPSVVTLLKNRKIPLEVCPWSNIFLNIFTESSHPIAELVRTGLNVTIGADDPGIFKRDLVDNYLYAASRGLDLERLEELARASMRYALPT